MYTYKVNVKKYLVPDKKYPPGSGWYRCTLCDSGVDEGFGTHMYIYIDIFTYTFKVVQS